MPVIQVSWEVEAEESYVWGHLGQSLRDPFLKTKFKHKGLVWLKCRALASMCETMG
jgi:hypothetical protein